MSHPQTGEALGASHPELWNALYQELRRLIVNGEFEPGERLLEARLAERFAVSRGPVRDALAELERMGLVTSVARRGTYVATFTETDIDELLYVTCGLERLAARQAAMYATSEQIDGLNRLLGELDDSQARGDAAETIEADLELHRHLVEASGNRRLLQLWMQISEQTRFVVAIVQRNLPDVRWGPRLRLIVDAVMNRDPEAAANAVEAAFEEAHVKLRLSSGRAFEFAPQNRGRSGLSDGALTSTGTDYGSLSDR